MNAQYVELMPSKEEFIDYLKAINTSIDNLSEETLDDMYVAYSEVNSKEAYECQHCHELYDSEIDAEYCCHDKLEKNNSDNNFVLFAHLLNMHNYTVSTIY